MIVTVSSFLFDTGVVLFTLSALTLLIFKFFKIAIVNMLVADVFFALAMVYPRRVIEVLGPDSPILDFIARQQIKPVFVAVLVYALLFAVQYLLCYVWRRTPQPPAPAESAPLPAAVQHSPPESDSAGTADAMEVTAQPLPAAAGDSSLPLQANMLTPAADELPQVQQPAAEALWAVLQAGVVRDSDETADLQLKLSEIAGPEPAAEGGVAAEVVGVAEAEAVPAAVSLAGSGGKA